MLKSLELFGFKSFADRARFDFSPGITGVVGPNGSGKSNVVDAVKWILGDQSAKSLRGREMTDVIFNGATGRKPNSFAEATLTFDNSSGFLPIESQEVQIGRRLWQSGDAEYLINRTTARLRDVRELLMGTGAGSAAYSIIEQGRVDQILQAGASSRRLIFEEAAGISLYKSRRTDAERRLARVDQNLLRLTDIVDEVEAQLNATRSQAEKAARYRELSSELREWWLGLAADDYRHHSAHLERVEQAVLTTAGRIEELNALQQGLQNRLSALDGEISDVDDRLRDVEHQRSLNRETVAGHDATIRHETARKRELDHELVRLRKQRAMMTARTREVAGELMHHRVVLEECETECRHRQAELDAHDERNRQLITSIEAERNTVEHCRRRLLERIREASSLENRVTGLESQLESAAATRQTAEQRRGNLDAQVAECRAECDRRRLRVKDASRRIAEVEQRLEELRGRRESLLTEQDRFQRTLASQREQRSAWQARKSVLEDLDSRREGLGIGVKEILSRAETSDYPPWNRILGSVADLLEVDLEQAALLEVALGSRAQRIVIEEFDSLIEYLNRGVCQISGRVGFMAHLMVLPAGNASRHQHQTDAGATLPPPPSRRGFDHFRIDLAALPDLEGRPGILHRADRLVRSSPRIPHLAEQLLADTWVVETLDAALELSAGEGRGCRFVTLQGELLDSDGTLIVGTVRSETALLSRKSELRRLKKDLDRLDLRISEEERRLTGLSDSLTDVDAQCKTVESEMQSLADHYSGLKAELASQEHELERLRADRDALDREISEIHEQEERVADELQAGRLELTRLQDDVQSLEAAVHQAEREVVQTEHRLNTLAQQRTAEHLDLAKQQERLHGLQTAFQRLEQDRQLRLQQSDEAERRFELAWSKRREIALHVLNSNAILAELFLAEEQVAAGAAAILAEKQDLRRLRQQLAEEELVLRRQRREQTDTQHREEIQARDLRGSIAALEQRIEEEYQVALADIVASGASALQSYLKEMEGRQPTGEEDDSPESTPSSRDSEGSAPPAGPQFEEVREELESRVQRLRRKLKHLGSVNTDSLRDLDELEARYERLSAQLADLVEAKGSLEEIVRRINTESRRLFTQTFESIREHFRDLFRKAFGGGDGDIVLEDPDDVLDCGIDIVARPPGKELKSITLMSGGEKTLTAFALLLAIFKCRPSPYCVLDEVDAALDEANVERLTALLKEFEQTTQFVVITHKKPTMTVCDTLHGVTMEQSGVSKRISVRFEDVSENGEFKPSPSQREAA